MESTKTIKCGNCGAELVAKPLITQVLMIFDDGAIEPEITFPIKCGCGCNLT